MNHSESITIWEIRALGGENVLYVDVRKHPDNREIPGSIRMPPERLAQSEHPPLPHDKTIVVYCDSGTSSRHLAAVLRERGFDARPLEGGYAAWCDHGNPTVPISTTMQD